MKATIILAAALSLAAAACSTAPAPATMPAAQAAPAAMNAAGRYDFSTTVQGQPVTGTIDVTGAPGAYRGQITTSITPPLPISGVTVEGQQMVVTADTPDGPLTLRMNFTDSGAFTGGWELAGDSGPVSGRRVS